MKKRHIKSPQQKFHVKKNDEVVVLAGTERGKRGKVLQVLRQVNRVLVEGLNMHKKAMRKTQDNPQGGIIEREAPMHVSNVMLAAVYDGDSNGEEKKSKKK